MDKLNFYLSESTLISIRQILWHLEKKEIEKTYRTINFELMLILVLGDFLKDEAVIEVRRSEYGDNRYADFSLGTLGKEKEQTFKTSELKENFLILGERNIASAQPPVHTLLKWPGGFPEFKDYRISFTRGWNEEFNAENYKERVDANCWLRFTFNIKDIDHKSLKNFLQKYLKNFRENKLLNSLDIVEDIFFLFNYEIKYGAKSKVVREIDVDEVRAGISNLENLYDKSEFSINKAKRFLEKIKERMGGYIKIIYNPHPLFEIDNDTKIFLEELKDIENLKRTRLFEAIFYLEMREGSYEIKEMIYNDAEKRLMIVLEEKKEKASKTDFKIFEKGKYLYIGFKEKGKKKEIKIGRIDSQIPILLKSFYNEDNEEGHFENVPVEDLADNLFSSITDPNERFKKLKNLLKISKSKLKAKGVPIGFSIEEISGMKMVRIDFLKKD
jgi:hypothetical protein